MAKRRGGGRRRRKGGATKKKDDKIYLDGEVVEALPNTMFRVQADNGLNVLATICGRMRRSWIRVLIGDRVSVEVSPYDPSRGRITFRYRANQGPPPGGPGGGPP